MAKMEAMTHKLKAKRKSWDEVQVTKGLRQKSGKMTPSSMRMRPVRNCTLSTLTPPTPPDKKLYLCDKISYETTTNDTQAARTINYMWLNIYNCLPIMPAVILESFFPHIYMPIRLEPLPYSNWCSGIVRCLFFWAFCESILLRHKPFLDTTPKKCRTLPLCSIL